MFSIMELIRGITLNNGDKKAEDVGRQRESQIALIQY
jgi:hypothetical protein